VPSPSEGGARKIPAPLGGDPATAGRLAGYAKLPPTAMRFTVPMSMCKCQEKRTAEVHFCFLCGLGGPAGPKNPSNRCNLLEEFLEPSGLPRPLKSTISGRAKKNQVCTYP
jgi:hypothetical protein